MSIEDGIVDSDVVKRFSEWMTARGIPYECPTCGKDESALAKHFVTPSQMMGSGQVMGTTYPMLMLVCDHCAATRLFSAVAAGLYKSDQGEQQ